MKLKKTNFDFNIAFYLYSFYCLTNVLKGLDVVSIQLPIVMFCYLLLMTSSSSRKNNSFKFLITITLLLIPFNYFFIFGQGGVGLGGIESAVGANFSLFNAMMPLLFICSGEFDYVNRDKMIRFVLLLTLVTAITTIIGTYRYQWPCRELATPDNIQLDRLYKSQNIGGYGFIYYLVLLCPMLLYEIRRKFSIIKVALLGVFVFCVVRSEYTTALLLLFITFCGFIIVYSKSKAIRIPMMLLILFVLLDYRSLLMMASTFFGSSSDMLGSRLDMAVDYSTYGTAYGDMGNREDLYSKSLQSFLSNPLFGGFFETNTHVGGHSEIFDFIGHSGLFGVTFLILLVRYIIKNTSVRNINIKNRYIKLLMFIALLLATLNTFMAPELFYGLLLVPLLMDKDKERVTTA